MESLGDGRCTTAVITVRALRTITVTEISSAAVFAF